MPDTSTSSKSKTLPNFYSAVGQMGGYSGSQPGASAGNKPGQSAADNGEKVKNVTALLEVIKKMDAMESDPEAKKVLEQVAGLVEQYMEKLQPGKKPGKDTMAGAGGEAGGAGAGMTGAGGDTGGAGATGAGAGSGAM